MPILDSSLLAKRALLPMPGNSTVATFGNVSYNRTILDAWGYQYFSNGTLSNNSWCLIVEPPYAAPKLLENGTFVNATWCSTALRPIGPRAQIGVAFAVAYSLCLFGVLMCLSKHGRLHLPREKRFYAIGRRWQWYYGICVSGTALISLFTNVDVDRYWVMELPIVLNVFFWYVMQMAAMALVWEAVRHWGSWKERQMLDPDPFSLPQNDRRARFEFWLPLVFYLWWWLSFFMVIPRNWGELELQRSEEQAAERAAPTATDIRFKIGALFLLLGWATIIASLRHSIKHYCPRNRGALNRTIGFVRYMPVRFWAILPLSLAIIAYQALCSFSFAWSPLNANGNNLAIYLGGWTPALLILVIQIVWGVVTPNEDSELIRQRRSRGQQVDRELGVVYKPAWWRRNDGGEDMISRLARNVREVGGGRPTARNVDARIGAQSQDQNQGVEMGPVSPSTQSASGPTIQPYGGKSDRRRSERSMQAAAEMLFPNPGGAGVRVDRRAELMEDGPMPTPPPYRDGVGRGREPDRTMRPSTGQRDNSAETTASITSPPQQIRSMLDV